MSRPWLTTIPGGVLIALLVQPRASKNALAGAVAEEFKVRLTSPPVDGAANRHCCEYLAKLLGVAKGAVQLESGETSRHKRVRVQGVSEDEVIRIFEGEGRGSGSVG